jgi:large subunit ribosomal protein L7/L12
MVVSKIEKLEHQKKQLEARIQAAKLREKQNKRKLETRLKILVGSHYLNQHRKEGSIQQLHNDLDIYLQKDTDKQVLSLLREEIAQPVNPEKDNPGQ